jgi:hypothetical protein
LSGVNYYFPSGFLIVAHHTVDFPTAQSWLGLKDVKSTMRYSKPSGRRIYRGRFFLLVLAADGLDERRRLDGRQLLRLAAPDCKISQPSSIPGPLTNPPIASRVLFAHDSRSNFCDASCCRLTEMIYRIRYLLLASVVGSASLRIVRPLALPPNACVISLAGEYSRGRARNGHTERGAVPGKAALF